MEGKEERSTTGGSARETETAGSICEHVSHMERPLYISATQLVTVYVCNGRSQFRLCGCTRAPVFRGCVSGSRSERWTAQRTPLKAALELHSGAYARECVKCTSAAGTILFSARSLAHFFLSRHSFTRFSGTMELRATDVRGNCNYVVSRIYRRSAVILPFQESVDHALISVSRNALANQSNQH